MPNAITAQGLTTATYAEILAYWTAQYQAIYGADVNLASDTPDGQMLGIQIQAILDMLDLITQTNASFDPDQAIGVLLAQRGAINGIQPQVGTASVTPITVVVDRALNLVGIDALGADPDADVYTISDNAGTQWQIQVSQAFPGAGSYIVNFQAALPGPTLATLNTIQTPVTVVVGVTSINNPTAASTIGLAQESDAAFKVRRQKSTAISAQGVHDALVAMLSNIPGVTYAKVWENDTGSTSDGTTPPGVPAGIPRNCIWAILAGTGAPAAIANAIYVKRNLGCNMKGAQSSVINQTDGSKFVVKWDNVVSQTLYIQFNAHSIDGITAINTAYIATQLALLFKPGVDVTVDSTSFGTLVQQIDPNCNVTGAGFSAAFVGPYTSTLAPAAANNQFTVSAVNIAITVI